MVSLSTPSDKLLRAQIGEAVSIVAKYDFPSTWPDLVSKLVETLSPTEYTVNVSVLQTAHSIFAPWKSEIRSDRLYATINLALEQFTSTYFALFRATATHILSPEAAQLDASSLGLLAECMVLLFALYYDMTAQDLPPVFEDSAEEFFGSDKDQGWFLRFLQWNPPVLVGDVSGGTPIIPNFHSYPLDLPCFSSSSLIKTARRPHSNRTHANQNDHSRNMRAVRPAIQRSLRASSSHLCAGRMGDDRSEYPRRARG